MMPRPALPASARSRGSILIIVLWICLGVVALTLYFANSMSSELRAADNRVMDIAARQAVAGGERYASHILSTYWSDGLGPELNDANPDCPYLAENLPVGDASFWFIGRDPNLVPTTEPVFGLMDECAKLNLNTATLTMLEGLPNMTPDLAAAIIAWRSTRTTATGGASASNTYATLNPPRLNKGAPFESVDELRLVYGATLDLLLGEDTNRNGALDRNEDDGDQSAPHDNADGILQPGILEYVTIYSAQPNTRPGGARRVNITTAQSRAALGALLQRRLSAARAAAILNRIGNAPFGSVAEFYVNSGLTAAEFARVHTYLTATTGASSPGLINVNTASATVLACIPGISVTSAAQIVAYRTTNPANLTTFAWLPGVIGRAAFIRAGPYITDQSYQFSVDVAAVGRNGRGYSREKVVFDLSAGAPRIINRQDLGGYSWALGPTVRQNLKTGVTSSPSS
jgi:type II secretory pathway component PulK